MTFTHALSTNNYGLPKFIVTSSAANGTHTTIQSAITAATAGDTVAIRASATPYTENITLKAGVNICAYPCDAGYIGGVANVIISGTCSFAAAGTVTISGVMLQTNGATAILALSGTAASIVNLIGCNLNCTANTGITNSVANTASAVNIVNCTGNLATTGIAHFSDSSTGTLRIENSTLGNSGVSATASTKSAGTLGIIGSNFFGPITYSSSSILSAFDLSRLDSANSNTTTLTTSGTGAITAQECNFASGTASSISVGAGTTVILSIVSLSSTNTNAITGAGTITYSGLSFVGTSKLINTTTQSVLNGSTFTPALKFGGASVGLTYTTQYGKFYRLDNVVFFSIYLNLSAKGSSTGAATITGLPFTSANDTGNYDYPMDIITGGGAAIQVIWCNLAANASSTSLFFEVAGVPTALDNNSFNNTTVLRTQGFYFI